MKGKYFGLTQVLPCMISGLVTGMLEWSAVLFWLSFACEKAVPLLLALCFFLLESGLRALVLRYFFASGFACCVGARLWMISVFGAGNLCMIWINRLWALFVFRIFTVVSASLWECGASSFLVQKIRVPAQFAGHSLHTFCSFTGHILAPFLLTVLFDLRGMRGIYVLFAGCSVAFLLLEMVVIKPAKSHPVWGYLAQNREGNGVLYPLLGIKVLSSVIALWLVLGTKQYILRVGMAFSLLRFGAALFLRLRVRWCKLIRQRCR